MRNCYHAQACNYTLMTSNREVHPTMESFRRYRVITYRRRVGSSEVTTEEILNAVCYFTIITGMISEGTAGTFPLVLANLKTYLEVNANTLILLPFVCICNNIGDSIPSRSIFAIFVSGLILQISSRKFIHLILIVFENIIKPWWTSVQSQTQFHILKRAINQRTPKTT